MRVTLHWINPASCFFQSLLRRLGIRLQQRLSVPAPFILVFESFLILIAVLLVNVLEGIPGISFCIEQNCVVVDRESFRASLAAAGERGALPDNFVQVSINPEDIIGDDSHIVRELWANM